MTDVILIEDVYKLGRVGEVVTVKPGYARNFLVPQKKALRASKANIAAFEAQKEELEKRAADNRQAAADVADALSGKSFTIIEQASEKGMLYGAVTSISASKMLNDSGYAVAKDAVQIAKAIKTVGIYNVEVVLHADVKCEIVLNIAISNEVAEQQAQDASAEANKPVAESNEDEAAA